MVARLSPDEKDLMNPLAKNVWKGRWVVLAKHRAIDSDDGAAVTAILVKAANEDAAWTTAAAVAAENGMELLACHDGDAVYRVAK